jgi:hypothetical protein
MYDFASRIAAGEKFPSLALGFKPLDPAVFKHHAPMPECMKSATDRWVYSITGIFRLVSHAAPLPFATKAIQEFF